MKVIHVVILVILGTILLSVLHIYTTINLLNPTCTYLCWFALLVFSIFCAFNCSKQTSTVQLLIGFTLFVFFGYAYFFVNECISQILPYLNAFWLVIFITEICFVIFMIYNNQKGKQRDVIKSKAELIKTLFRDNVLDDNELKKRYEAWGWIDRITYDSFLKAIYDAVSENWSEYGFDDNLIEYCAKLKNKIQPLMFRVNESDLFTNIEGDDKRFFIQIYSSMKEKLCNHTDLDNLVELGKRFAIYQNQIKAENERNNQSLTISIIGIYLSILFFLISSLLSDGGEMIKNYFNSQ